MIETKNIILAFVYTSGALSLIVFWIYIMVRNASLKELGYEGKAIILGIFAFVLWLTLHNLMLFDIIYRFSIIWNILTGLLFLSFDLSMYYIIMGTLQRFGVSNKIKALDKWIEEDKEHINMLQKKKERALAKKPWLLFLLILVSILFLSH